MPPNHTPLYLFVCTHHKLLTVYLINFESMIRIVYKHIRHYQPKYHNIYRVKTLHWSAEDKVYMFVYEYSILCILRNFIFMFLIDNLPILKFYGLLINAAARLYNASHALRRHTAYNLSSKDDSL